jgi:hypothetical protein
LDEEIQKAFLEGNYEKEAQLKIKKAQLEKEKQELLAKVGSTDVKDSRDQKTYGGVRQGDHKGF